MNHFMLDIETFGTGTNAAIVSLGVVAFDPPTGVLGGTLEIHIDLEKSPSPGVMDAATVMWWLGREPRAQRALLDTCRIPLGEALLKLGSWLNNQGVSPDDEDGPHRLWSKPPQFDERILREAYARHQLQFPFHWRCTRDVRTFLDDALTLCGIEPPLDAARTTIKHSALEDAKWQAHCVSSVTRTWRDQVLRWRAGV